MKLTKQQKLDAYNYALSQAKNIRSIEFIGYVCLSLYDFAKRNILTSSGYIPLMSLFPEWYDQRPPEGTRTVGGSAWWDDSDPARIEAIEKCISIIQNLPDDETHQTAEVRGV